MQNKLKEHLEKAKQSQYLITLTLSEADGNMFVQKGKVFDFDEEFLELLTFDNIILIRLDTIQKIKLKIENGN